MRGEVRGGECDSEGEDEEGGGGKGCVNVAVREVVREV